VAVLDTSAAIDYLLDEGVCDEVATALEHVPGPTAPDVMVFEVLAVLRRHTLRGGIDEQRAAAALRDLEDMPIEWFSSMSLRERAWELRDNVGPADALFVALAEQLGERLLTKDAGLAAAVERLGHVEVHHLPDPRA
jgi:predicted nucleic acid-binding protein